MATPDEKKKALKELLGGDEQLYTDVLARLDLAEKQADDAGLSFKAKKTDSKPPANKAAEETGDDEEEAAAEGTADEEGNPDEEEEPEEGDMKGKKKEASDQDLPVFIGDVPVDEFADKLARILAGTIEPYLTDIQTLKEKVETLTQTFAVSLKSDDQKTAQIAALNKKVEAQEKELKELKASAPKAVRQGFQASEDDSTVLTEEQAKEKNLDIPHADPIGGFMGFVLGAPGQMTPPPQA